jgi:8-oxo-dGTP pyrophosphatase MutT (NUDIX family)
MPDSTSIEVKVATVDVYVIRPKESGWRVLLLQRAPATRCPGSWETVHGRIETGERPEEAAVREVVEETGLTVARLYSISVQPFYIPSAGIVTAAVVFAAFVDEPADVRLADEHEAHAWLSPAEAMERFSWPRSRAVLPDIVALLNTGDAGPVEDVLRVF